MKEEGPKTRWQMIVMRRLKESRDQEEEGRAMRKKGRKKRQRLGFLMEKTQRKN